MPHVRLTLIQPLPGMDAQVLDLLKELDGHLAQYDGLIFSTIIEDVAPARSHPLLGRVAVWSTAEQANHAAMQDHVIAARSRLHTMGKQPIFESLFEVKAGFVPAEVLPLKRRALKTWP